MIGAWVSSPAAVVSRGQSSLLRWPLRSRWSDTSLCEHSRRCTSCSLLISSENTETGVFARIAAFSAMLSANEVL